ncbi:UNKNOWN [Stylonychia lemnae]|uniref:Uncharacterized protein n=1 Tax=Stylonychia lemnae TaxID=5949 RepID=A0A078AAM0_STYLE|nr:UNKNOWN [Stylonychia lemnae]|eukprot:CDW79325.1 UNKNOWN [Stylonychia lemnae]
MSEFDRFRGSSKAFIVFMLFIFLLYAAIIMIRMIKVKGDKNKIPVMPAFFEAYKRVFEVDMMYSFLVYFMAISLGTMYEFLCIFGIVLIGISVLLTIAHLKDHRKLKLIAKIANFSLTVIGFLNIFINDMYFSDFAISK